MLQCSWIEKLTHNLVSRASYIDEVLRMRLNTSVFSQGKGLMEKFDFCKINSCFDLVKSVHILLGTNVVTVLLFQILKRNQSYSYEKPSRVFSSQDIYKKHSCKVITSKNRSLFLRRQEYSNWSGSKITVAQLIRD